MYVCMGAVWVSVWFDDYAFIIGFPRKMRKEETVWSSLRWAMGLGDKLVVDESRGPSLRAVDAFAALGVTRRGGVEEIAICNHLNTEH